MRSHRAQRYLIRSNLAQERRDRLIAFFSRFGPAYPFLRDFQIGSCILPNNLVLFDT